MIRIHVICEGQTEESFVQNVLNEYFENREIFLYPSLLGISGHKGGVVNYKRVFTDIKNHLNDTHSYVTTFFDFYGIDRNFPGYAQAANESDYKNRYEIITKSLYEKICSDLNVNQIPRLIPYVQMHEFEGLLFSNVKLLAESFGKSPQLIYDCAIRAEFDSPEEINNSPQTAPSKRIVRAIPEYEKVTHGIIVSRKIGLKQIRAQCALFNQWITHLENLEEI